MEEEEEDPEEGIFLLPFIQQTERCTTVGLEAYEDTFWRTQECTLFYFPK